VEIVETMVRIIDRDLLARGLGDLDQPGVMESSKDVGVTEEGERTGRIVTFMLSMVSMGLL
jgi:hypothetical protein